MKTVIGIIMVLLLTVGGLIGCQQSSPVRPSPPTPTPPSAPSNLTADAVSPSQVRLHWFDSSNNEEGFKLYRDSSVIATLPANTTAYEDMGLKAATTYQYVVKAFNQAGESGASLCTVRTPNPPIKVTLDRIGVYFDHDPTWVTGAGDIYLYIGVADGKGQPQTARIPPTSVIKLNDNETTEIGQQIFSTDCVGDELKVVVVAFESDALHGVILGVIKVALSAYLGGGSGTAVSLITTLLESQPSAEGGCPEGVTAETPEDDFVGAIERTWTSAENWGIGSYKDVRSGDLRLWFTIESPTEPLAPAERPTEPPRSGELIATESLNLAPFDESALESRYTEPPSQFPFNDCGIYMSKPFLVEANQTLDIIFISDYRVAFEGGKEFHGGLFGQIPQVEVGGQHQKLYESWVKSHEFLQSGNTWETRVTFSPDETGYYQLYIANLSGESCWCQYTMSLR